MTVKPIVGNTIVGSACAWALLGRKISAVHDESVEVSDEAAIADVIVEALRLAESLEVNTREVLLRADLEFHGKES